MPVIGAAFSRGIWAAAESLIGIILRLSAAQQEAQDKLF
jgi:hypothetical protein